MRIAHISTQPTWRGGEQQIFYLHEELIDRGVDSIVLAKKESAISQKLKDEKLPFREMPFRSAYDLRTAYQIKSFAKNQKIDIIHAHTAKGHTLVMLANLLGLKAKIIVSRRVDVPVKNNWFSRYKYNHPRILKIICVSNKIKEITSLDVTDSNRLVTIHSGVDLKKFKQTKQNTIRNEFRIPQETLIIGNISALALHKDLPTFLKVAKKLLDGRNNLIFIVVGEGEEQPKIDSLIRELGLQEKVLLTGFRADVPQILADFDLFLFTSITEGLGTTVIDALASGTPVVSTNAGGVSEILEMYNAGMLADIRDVDGLANLCLQFIDNPQLRKERIVNGLRTAEQFSKEKTAAKTLELYKSLG